MAEERKPEGWEELTPVGSAAGPATVGYDKQRHRNYHVNTDGSIAWHDLPEGYTFKDGRLVAQGDGPAGQVTGTPEQPASIPGTAVQATPVEAAPEASKETSGG